MFPGMTMMMSDMQVVVSENAVEESGYKFKPSRYRSKRVTKKLLKRFGSMVKYKPAAFRMDYMGREVLVVHPVIKRKMQEHQNKLIAEMDRRILHGSDVSIFGAFPA